MLSIVSLALGTRYLSLHHLNLYLRPALAISGPRIPGDALKPLLIDLVYRHETIADGLTVLEGSSGSKYVPLAKSALALGFRLQKENAGLRFKGFLRLPSESIDFDAAKGVVSTRHKRFDVGREAFVLSDGEMYIDCSVLATVSGLSFKWKENAMELAVESEVGLSLIKQAFVRHTSPSRRIKSQAFYEKPLTTPYLPFSLPSVEGTFSSSGESRRGADSPSSSATLTGYGDLFCLGARYQMLTTSSGRTRTYMTLGRRSANADLLGSLKATEFEVGDIGIPQISFLSRNRAGFGISVDNMPLNEAGGAGQGRIEESSPTCIQAELYRNDELLDLVVPQEGKVAFENVPLEEGPNLFRVELVKSDGNVEHKTQVLYGDALYPKPGSFRFQASVGIPRESVFGATRLGRPTNSKGEISIQTQRGIRPGTWSSLGGIYGQGPEVTNLAVAGLHSWHKSTLWNFSLLGTDQGASAIALGASKRIGKGMFSLEQSTPLGRLGANQEEPSLNGTSLSWNTSVGRIDRPVSYGFRFESGLGPVRATQLSTHFSSRVGNSVVGNRLYYRNSLAGSDFFAITDIGCQIDSYYLRLGALYGGTKNFELRSGQASVSRFISPEHLISYGFNYENGQGRGISPNAGIYRILGPFAIGANMTYAPSGSVKFAINLSTALNLAGTLRPSSPGTASAGRVRARVYFAKDPSGRYQAGDKMVEGIGIRVGQRSETYVTNGRGICEVTNLPTDQAFSIELDDASLIDPLWIPLNSAFNVVARPGREVIVDIPLIEGAEINGRATNADPDKPTVATLKSRDGKGVATSTLDQSGNYSFTSIRPGKYLLGLYDFDGRLIVERSVTIASGVANTGYDLKIPSAEKN